MHLEQHPSDSGRSDVSRRLRDREDVHGDFRTVFILIKELSARNPSTYGPGMCL